MEKSDISFMHLLVLETPCIFFLTFSYMHVDKLQCKIHIDILFLAIVS